MKSRIWLAWTLALLSVGGCATTRPDTTAEDPAGDLRQARLEYRWEGTASSGVAPASHDDQSAVAPMSVTTIEYPHPDGDAQSALVTVVEQGPAETKSRKSRMATFASWADQMLPGLIADERITTAKGLKISKRELDETLREFVSEGGLESSSESSVAVAVEINGRSQTSRPKNSPALARLTDRVKSEGMVLPADHPHVAQRVASHASTDDFYRSLESQAGSPETP